MTPNHIKQFLGTYGLFLAACFASFIMTSCAGGGGGVYTLGIVCLTLFGFLTVIWVRLKRLEKRLTRGGKLQKSYSK